MGEEDATVPTSAELSRLLDDAGLRQEDVADRIGVSQSTVSRWLSGHRPLPPGRALQVAALAVDDVETRRPSAISRRRDAARGRLAAAVRRLPVLALEELARNAEALVAASEDDVVVEGPFSLQTRIVRAASSIAPDDPGEHLGEPARRGDVEPERDLP